MSIDSIVDADYAVVIGYLRDVLASGGNLDAYKTRYTLNVVKDSVARMTACNAAVEAVSADIVVLDAATCTAGSGVAAAAVVAQAVLDLDAALISEPTYVANTLADGLKS